MNEDPRYLRNQSRALHRLHRRNRRWGRWIMVLWLLVVGGLTTAAALDVAAGLGWGFEAGHIWGGLLLAVGGGAVWLFVSLIDRVVMGLSRRRYGREPEGPWKADGNGGAVRNGVPAPDRSA